MEGTQNTNMGGGGTAMTRWLAVMTRAHKHPYTGWCACLTPRDGWNGQTTLNDL